jgi:hypothetical protein
MTRRKSLSKSPRTAQQRAGMSMKTEIGDPGQITRLALLSSESGAGCSSEDQQSSIFHKQRRICLFLFLKSHAMGIAFMAGLRAFGRQATISRVLAACRPARQGASTNELSTASNHTRDGAPPV